MGYWPSMSWFTEGINVVAPVKWRQLDGLMGAYWQAESKKGAKGYYLADDPRIMVFFNDVSPNVGISNEGDATQKVTRPMARAIYIPPGVPMWTTSGETHRFSHLNLHIHRDKLLRFLAPSVGRSSALAALGRPVELPDSGAVGTLAQLIVDELDTPSKPGVYTEGLVGSLFAGLLDLQPCEAAAAPGRLTKAQMRKLTAFMDANGSGRIGVADMAASVGLSESWFGTVFKHTVGQTPLQWQLQRRIETAKPMLLAGVLTIAEVSARLGFTDQAHFTRAFRQITGETPAAWRRAQD